MSLVMRGKSSSTRVWSRTQGKCHGTCHGCRPWRLVSPSRSSTHVASTMDLVSMDDVRSKSNSIHSTLEIAMEHDVVSSAHRNRTTIPPEPWHALVAAVESVRHDGSWNRCTVHVAHEMDLVQATRNQNSYDKLLLLVHHAEDESLRPSDTDAPIPDCLTRRGVGQALNLSRRTATFCNHGLEPQLFVVTASRKVLQTTFLSFPYDTPHHSLRSTPWICHSHAQDATCASLAELQREFTGIDCSRCLSSTPFRDANASATEERVEQVWDLLDWIQGRTERVIVVSGDSLWLESLGCLLNYNGANTEYSHGEMRAVGVRFD